MKKNQTEDKKKNAVEDLITQLIEMGLGNVIDKRKTPLLLADEVYQSDCRDLSELEERYEALDISDRQRMIINDYMALTETAHCRANDLCYIAGIRDAVLFLNQVDLLKK